MEDIADAINGHTREEIYGRVYGRTYGRAAKHDDYGRPKSPPPSPVHKGQAGEGSTNLRRNKATEPIAEKETTTDLAVTVTKTINATPNAPNPHCQVPGEKLGSHLSPCQTTWRR